MIEKPLYAPGCFGLPSVFSKDDICRACEFSKPCEVAHLIALRQLREFCGVIVKEPTRARGDLPVKVKKIFEELGKTAEEVKHSLMIGKNPYSIKAGFIGIACHILLVAKVTTRDQLAKAMMELRKYNEPTADVYARHSVQILLHCGVVTVQDDQISLIAG